MPVVSVTPRIRFALGCVFLLSVFAAGPALAAAPASARNPVPTGKPDCIESLNIDPQALLRWSQAQQLCGYRHMETLWPANTVARGKGAASSLPRGKALALPGLDAFMRGNGVRGLLVLHQGRIVAERYRGDFTRASRWTSFSMAKSITSILVGAALQDGSIASLDDPVLRYLPELGGGAYDGVTVRQILTMTSGAAWNENYQDPNSDVAKLAAMAGKPSQEFLAYMAARPRMAGPGTLFTYSTGEANLIGFLVRRATGKSLAAYLSEIIWQPFGMEQDAIWLTDKEGKEVSGCCFSASLRDYGRLGLFLLARGVAAGVPRLAPQWLEDATAASGPSRAKYPYGYQWGIGKDGVYQANGIFGQVLHIDPKRELVIVMLSAWELPTGTTAIHAERRAFIQAITHAAAARKK